MANILKNIAYTTY